MDTYLNDRKPHLSYSWERTFCPIGLCTSVILWADFICRSSGEKTMPSADHKMGVSSISVFLCMAWEVLRSKTEAFTFLLCLEVNLMVLTGLNLSHRRWDTKDLFYR